MQDYFWKVANPSQWPERPKWLSFSTLKRLETCPKQWALSSALYRSIWDQPGYPPSLHTAALEGTVVHAAVETIVQKLLTHDCKSSSEPNAIFALKNVGGYTQLIGKQIESTMERYLRNPRCAPFCETVRQRLHSRVAELRFQTQTLVSRIRLSPYQSVHSRTVGGGKPRRMELQTGSHNEVELRSPELGWRGMADLLTISDSSVEIRDYKTGAPNDDHQFQLWLYALLWSHDVELNPTRRKVDKLVVSYVSEDVDLPVPNDTELKTFEEGLLSRTESVLSQVQIASQLAKTDGSTCACCDVRHLCSDYWTALDTLRLEDDRERSAYSDVQMKVDSVQGMASWKGIVQASSELHNGETVLLRVNRDHPCKIHERQTVRLLNARVACEEELGEGMPTVVTIGAIGEAYVLE